MTKEEIFNKLRACKFIIKNNYFEEYLKIVNTEYLGTNYKEAHHIFCKSFSKNMNEKIIEEKSNLVVLEFKDLSTNNSVMNAGAKVNLLISCTQKTGLQ